MNFRLISDSTFWIPALWMVMFLVLEWLFAFLDQMLTISQASKRYPNQISFPLLANAGNWMDILLTLLAAWMVAYSMRFWDSSSVRPGIIWAFLITWIYHVFACHGAGGTVYPDALTHPNVIWHVIPDLKPAGWCHFMYMFSLIFFVYMFFFGPASWNDPGASFRAALVVAGLLCLHVLVSTIQPKLYVGDPISLQLFIPVGVFATIMMWMVRIQYLRPH